jgi:hypothetical protein
MPSPSTEPMAGVERRHRSCPTPPRRLARQTAGRVALLAPIAAIALAAPAHAYIDPGQTASEPAQPLPVLVQQPPIPILVQQPPIPIR